MATINSSVSSLLSRIYDILWLSTGEYALSVTAKRSLIFQLRVSFYHTSIERSMTNYPVDGDAVLGNVSRVAAVDCPGMTDFRLNVCMDTENETAALLELLRILKHVDP